MFKREIKKAKGVFSDSTKSAGVAIDIGLYSVKCATFEKGRLRLNEFPLFDEPKDIRMQDQHDLAEVQMNAVKNSVGLIDSNSEIIISPQPSLQVLTKIVQRSASSELSETLEKELHLEPDKITYDTQELKEHPILKRSNRENPKISRTLIATAELDFVYHSIGLLSDYQQQVKIFTPGTIALLNYLLLINEGNTIKPRVLLDIGAFYSQLIVIFNKEKFLARTIELGGIHLNQELVDKLNMDFETAEQIKLERGLIDDSFFSSDGRSKFSSMFQAVNGVLSQLVDEVKNTLTYFEDYFLDDMSGSEVLLAGGSAKLKNLDRYISNEIGLPVKLADHCPYDLDENQTYSPQFASTVGLLRNPTHSGLFNINLINNIDGMLFRLREGDFYLTKDGFINKKKYKKKKPVKSISAATTDMRQTPVVEAPTPSVIVLIRELQKKVKAVLKGEKVDMRVSFRDMDKSSVQKPLKIFFVVFGLLFLLVYGTHQFYWSPKMKQVDRSINRYLGKRNEVNQSLVYQPLNPEIFLVQTTKIDKILWTNKLKTIAAALPKKVWISDIEIKGSTEETESFQVGKRSLIFYCHVTSNGQDHLREIARFIKNLKNEKEFLKDFSGIKFHSADRNQEEKSTIDFTLTLPLARNMLMEKKEQSSKEESGAPTGKIQENIKHFKNLQDDRYRDLDSLR